MKPKIKVQKSYGWNKCPFCRKQIKSGEKMFFYSRWYHLSCMADHCESKIRKHKHHINQLSQVLDEVLKYSQEIVMSKLKSK